MDQGQHYQGERYRTLAGPDPQPRCRHQAPQFWASLSTVRASLGPALAQPLCRYGTPLDQPWLRPPLHPDPDGPMCQSEVNSWAGHEQKVPPRLAGWVGTGGRAWCLAKARLTEGLWHGLHFSDAAWGNFNFAPIFLVHVWAHGAGPPKLQKKMQKKCTK